MVVQQQEWPPSGRDFDVYRRVKVDCVSTRETAKEAGLSQTRICQIVDRVAGFLADVAPASKEDEKRQQRLYVAEQVAAERVDAMYGKAVQAWHGSQGMTTTTREVETPLGPPTKVHLTRMNGGEARYLVAAVRLAMYGAKLPVSLLGTGVVASEDEEAVEGEHPPVGDCSPNRVEAVENDSRTQITCDASPFIETACDDLPTGGLPPDEELLLPVQFPVRRKPEEGGRADGRHLSRAQRRARQRLLERKLKKG